MAFGGSPISKLTDSSGYVIFPSSGDSPNGQLEERKVQYGTDPLSSSEVAEASQPESGKAQAHITTISHSEKEFHVPFGEKHPKFTLVLKVLAIALVFFGIPGIGMGVGVHFGAIEAIKNTVWLNTTVSVGGTAYILVGGVLSGGLVYLSIIKYKEEPPDVLQ